MIGAIISNVFLAVFLFLLWYFMTGHIPGYGKKWKKLLETIDTFEAYDESSGYRYYKSKLWPGLKLILFDGKKECALFEEGADGECVLASTSTMTYGKIMIRCYSKIIERHFPYVVKYKTQLQVQWGNDVYLLSDFPRCSKSYEDLIKELKGLDNLVFQKWLKMIKDYTLSPNMDFDHYSFKSWLEVNQETGWIEIIIRSKHPIDESKRIENLGHSKTEKDHFESLDDLFRFIISYPGLPLLDPFPLFRAAPEYSEQICSQVHFGPLYKLPKETWGSTGYTMKGRFEMAAHVDGCFTSLPFNQLILSSGLTKKEIAGLDGHFDWIKSYFSGDNYLRDLGFNCTTVSMETEYCECGYNFTIYSSKPFNTEVTYWDGLRETQVTLKQAIQKALTSMVSGGAFDVSIGMIERNGASWIIELKNPKFYD